MNTHTHSTLVPSAPVDASAGDLPRSRANSPTGDAQAPGGLFITPTPDLEADMIQAHRVYESEARSFALTHTDGARARMNRANQAWFTATNHYQKQQHNLKQF